MHNFVELIFLFLPRTERVGELEAAVKEQEKEASEVISKWEESYSALEKKNSELLTALEAKDADSEALSSLQTRLDETQVALDETKAKLSDGENAAIESQGKTVLFCGSLNLPCTFYFDI